MKKQTKLNLLPRQILFFIKKHLYNFYSGKEIKPATKTRPPLKASFQYIIHIMVAKKLQFLIDIIYKANPDVNPKASIPFKYLETIFRSLLLKFTTTLFTKLNYVKIFESFLTFPPYFQKQRFQVCFNTTRLYLYFTK